MKRKKKGCIMTTASEKGGGDLKALFKSRRELKAKLDRYFGEYLEETGEIADIESLADFLGTTREELLFLMDDEKFGDLLSVARNRIAKIKKQLAFGGKIPAAVLSFDLKNNHGYKDRPDDEKESAKETAIIFNGKAEEWAE